MNEHWNQLRANLELTRSDALEEVESDEEIMLLGSAQSDAAWLLLNAPAPDMAALACKLEVFRDEAAYELADDLVQTVLQAMIADARRLGQEG